MNLKIDYDNISGNKKDGTTLLKPFEKKLIKKMLPLVPSFIETYHLTWATLFLSLGTVFVALLARENIHWLWLNSLIVVFQHIADALDGEVGRQRRTGLVKWGFYMDHFFDFVFGCALFIAYLILFPELSYFFIIVLITISAYFLHEALTCIALGKYNVAGYYGLGPTEIYLIVISLNTVIILSSPLVAKTIIVLVFLPFLLTLPIRIYKSQKRLWETDIKDKKKKARPLK